MLRGEPDLAHELDRPDVDAELERRGGDERAQVAGAEAGLHPVPALLREAPVVRGHHLRRRDARRAGARGARRAGGCSRTRSWCGARCTSSAMLSSTSPICSADVTASSSPSGSSSPRSRSRRWPASTIAGSGRLPTSRRATVSIGRWVAESPTRCGTCRVSASRRSSVSARCAPTLVARDRVDLVDDHRVDGAQEVAPAGTRDEQVERLGRGDHEGGWAAQHRGALGAGRVAGAHRHPQLRARRVRAPRRRPAISASGRSRFSAMSTASALSGDT